MRLSFLLKSQLNFTSFFGQPQTIATTNGKEGEDV
jgi:hypothetical protein